jgi:hypothetical protein
MRWVSLLPLLVLLLHAEGCRLLGPLSPLRPVEQVLVYPNFSSLVVGHDDRQGEVLSQGRQVWIETPDKQTLDARYFAHPRPQAVVLYCHGNAGTVDQWAILAARLHLQHRLSILVFDYRGYGRSTGISHERGILTDAAAARDWLARENGLQPEEIVLMGRSLGGAVAVDLAAHGGARGLILESTFPSLPEVARQHAAWLLPGWNMTQRLNSAEKLRQYPGPLLQSHGDEDHLIPLALGEKLFEAAPGPKQFVVVHGASHVEDHIRYCAYERELFLRNLPRNITGDAIDGRTP